jgi:heat shock protein HslJ
MNKLTVMGISLIGLALAGCQSLPVSDKSQNTQASGNSMRNKQVISIEQLKNQRWQLAYVINSNGNILNLKNLQFSQSFGHFDITDNSNKAVYERVTSMAHIIDFNFGCNSFGTGMSLNSDTMIIDNTIIQTLIGCSDVEDDLRDALKGESQLNYDAKANRLTMTTHNNYRFVWDGIPKPQHQLPTIKDLESYQWELEYILANGMAEVGALSVPQDNPTKPRRYPMLSFDNGRANYSVGCNQLSSSFTMTPVGIANMVNSVSTLMACPADVAKSEKILQQKMQGPSELKIMKFSKETAKLFQTSNDGSELVWQGTLKPDVKYGKGETLYLEIAPQDERCDQVTYKRCLMVREIIYNEQGIKTSQGQWHKLYEKIEGYEKSPSQGNIIRVKRYRTPPTDTKGYGNLYVLDIIIETKTLDK